MSKTRVLIVCHEENGKGTGKPCRKSLAEAIGAGLKVRGGMPPGELWQLSTSALLVKCPKHDTYWVNVGADKLEAAKRAAARSSGRVEIRVWPNSAPGRVEVHVPEPHATPGVSPS